VLLDPNPSELDVQLWGVNNEWVYRNPDALKSPGLLDSKIFGAGDDFTVKF